MSLPPRALKIPSPLHPLAVVGAEGAGASSPPVGDRGMAGTAASVERVRDRATGLDKFVLREARGSSVEVRSPFRSTVASIIGICIARFVLQKSYLLDLHPRFAAPTKLIPLRLLDNCARLDCGRVNWVITISE